MASKCPKCGQNLTLLNLSQNCPNCKVNLVFYQQEEGLLADSQLAETEHARTQQKFDRVRAVTIGSKYAIIRLIILVLPLAALFLPLAKVAVSAPFIERATTINAYSLYTLVSSLDFDALFTMLDSSIVGPAFTAYTIALVLILVAVLCSLIELILVLIAGGKRWFGRNLFLSLLGAVTSGVSIYFFTQFAAKINAVFPGACTASIQFGIFVVIAMFLAVAVINIIIKVKIGELPVKYKQCCVNGVPYDDEFIRTHDKKGNLLTDEEIAAAASKK